MSRKIINRSGAYKISEYIDDIKNGNIKYPKIQRDLVWNFEKKKKFLKSLKRNHPIGCIILAEYNYDNGSDSETFIIDGLQRTSTLIEIYTNIFKFIETEEILKIIEEYWIKFLNHSETSFNKIEFKELIEEIKKDNCKKNSIENVIENILQKNKFYIDENRVPIFKKIMEFTLRDIRTTYNLDDYQLLISFFSDTPDVISEVFVNINTEGERLKELDIIKAKCSNKINNYLLNDDERYEINSYVNEKIENMYKDVIGDILNVNNLEKSFDINCYDFVEYTLYKSKLWENKNIKRLYGLQKSNLKIKDVTELFFYFNFLISLYHQKEKSDKHSFVLSDDNFDLLNDLFKEHITSKELLNKYNKDIENSFKFLSSSIEKFLPEFLTYNSTNNTYKNCIKLNNSFLQIIFITSYILINKKNNQNVLTNDDEDKEKIFFLKNVFKYLLIKIHKKDFSNGSFNKVKLEVKNYKNNLPCFVEDKNLDEIIKSILNNYWDDLTYRTINSLFTILFLIIGYHIDNDVFKTKESILIYKFSSKDKNFKDHIANFYLLINKKNNIDIGNINFYENELIYLLSNDEQLKDKYIKCINKIINSENYNNAESFLQDEDYVNYRIKLILSMVEKNV